MNRFDREDDGSKLHQEDLCRALDLPPMNKYGEMVPHVSLDGALRFVTDVCGESSGREMARRIGFVIASGNGDAHLKNWSLLWGNTTRPTLTPCYDLVATISWAHQLGWENPARPGGPLLALRIGGEHRFALLDDRVLAAHVENSGQSWASEERLAGIIRARDAWRQVEPEAPQAMRAARATHWQRVPVLRNLGL